MEVSEILERADIAEYIRQYIDGDYEEKNGELWCISPLNPVEKTPSFSIRPDASCFFDFSTGQGGNLLEFIKLHDGCGTAEAVNKLKAWAGINDDNEDGGAITLRLSATGIAKKFRQREPGKSKCVAQVLPEDYMERYPFDMKHLKLWADEGISYDVMREFGVRYDPVDNRIVYPIRNLSGEIFCVSGRTCDPDWKEKKLRKYTYTSSIGSLPAIYALSDNRKEIYDKKEIILFEGCKSVLKMATWGYRNAAALLTSHLSDPQFAVLVRLASFAGVRAVFALDSDIDITKDKLIRRLTHYASVEWVKNFDELLEPKEAPVDRGRDVWMQLFNKRISLK